MSKIFENKHKQGSVYRLEILDSGPYLAIVATNVQYTLPRDEVSVLRAALGKWLEEHPEPKWVPWTGYNCPIRLGDYLCLKGGKEQRTVTGVVMNHKEIRITLDSGSTWRGEDLLKLYTFNGNPCGTLQQP